MARGPSAAKVAFVQQVQAQRGAQARPAQNNSAAYRYAVGAQQNQLSDHTQQLANQYDKQQAQKRASKGGGSSWGGLIGDALHDIALPGSFALSAVNQGALGLRQVLGEKVGKNQQGWDAFTKNAFALKQPTQYATEARTAGKDTSGALFGNKYADMGFNFGVSAATDPLTYVAPATALEGGSEEVATRLISPDVVENIGRKVAAESGLPADAANINYEAFGHDAAQEMASKVLKGGKRALSSDDVKMAFDTTGGMKFNVPGTGRILGERLGFEHPVQLPLVPKGVTDALSAPLAAAKDAIGDTKLGNWFHQNMQGQLGAKWGDAIRGGSVDALVGKNAERAGGLSSKVFQQATLDEYAKMSRQWQGHGEDVVRAVEGDPAAISKLDGMGVDHGQLTDLLGRMRQQMIDKGVPVGEVDNYFPRLLTDEASAALRKGQPFGGDTPFFMKGRTNVAGAKLADGTVLEGPTFAIRDTVNKWAEEQGLGKGFYEANPDKVMPAYIAAVSKRIGKQEAINKLQEAGIVVDARHTVEVADKKGARSAATASKWADQAAAKGEKATAEATSARQAADENSAAQMVAGTQGATNVGNVDAALSDVAAKPKISDILAQGQEGKVDAANPQPFGADTSQTVDAAQRELKNAKVSVQRAADRRAAQAAKVAEVTQEAPAADKGLLAAHDALTNNPTRMAGFANSDPADVGKYFDKLESAAKRSGNADAIAAVKKGDTAFLNGNVGAATQHSEAALSLIHDTATGTTVAERSDEFMKEARAVTAGGPEFQAASQRALETLSSLPADDQITRGYIDTINTALSNNWPYASAAAREQFIAEESKFLDGLGSNAAKHAEMFGVTQFDDAVDHLDTVAPGWRDRGQDAIFGESPPGTPSFKGAPITVADVAKGPVEAVPFQMLERVDAAQAHMADVNGALESEARRAEDAVMEVRAKLASPETLPSEHDLLGFQEYLLNRRADVLAKAQGQGDAFVKRAMALEAQGLDAESKAAKYFGQEKFWREAAASQATTKQVDKLIEAVHNGLFKTLTADPSLAAPNEVADALNMVAKVSTREGMQGFLKYYDKALNYVKSWELATPGFLTRLTMGHLFNGYLADMEIGAYTRYFSDSRAFENGTLSGAARDQMESIQKYIGSHTGQYSHYEVQEGGAKLYSKLNPFSAKNYYVQGIHKGLGKLTEFMRGAMLYDGARAGLSEEQNVARMLKFHFDYSDLTPFEQNVAKRVIPFYTWTRKNLPLQLQMILERPGKYARYQQAKSAIELSTPPENVVPSYFNELFGIRTPLHMGGGQVYLTPRLPFTEAMGVVPIGDHGFEPGKPLSMITPLIKTPIERAMNHQFFKDIPFTDKTTPMPGAWAAIPGLKQGLQAIGAVGSDGKMTDRDAYTVGQYLPNLALVQRLAPTEKKYQERAMSSWLNSVGVPLRANTTYEQTIEKFRQKLESGKLSQKKVWVTKGQKFKYVGPPSKTPYKKKSTLLP